MCRLLLLPQYSMNFPFNYTKFLNNYQSFLSINLVYNFQQVYIPFRIIFAIFCSTFNSFQYKSDKRNEQ